MSNHLANNSAAQSGSTSLGQVDRGSAETPATLAGTGPITAPLAGNRAPDLNASGGPTRVACVVGCLKKAIQGRVDTAVALRDAQVAAEKAERLVDLTLELLAKEADVWLMKAE